MRSLAFAISFALLAMSCGAAEWNGRLFGKRLGDPVSVPADAETCEMGLPYVGFTPEQIFLEFTGYAVWVTPTTGKTAAIVAAATIGKDDEVGAKLLRKKTAMLLQTKFPEAQAKEDDQGDWSLTMKNGDIIGVEIKDGLVLIQAIRPFYLQLGVAEFNKKVKTGKWTGNLFGKTLGDAIFVPADAETCEMGLKIVGITPDESWEGFGTYAVWVTPTTKKIAAIIAVAEIGEDKSEAKILRNRTARLLKAKFPEAQAKEDDDGDWSITMKNGDSIGVEIKDGLVLVQLFRPVYLQLGISEFKKSVMSDTKSLDAL